MSALKKNYVYNELCKYKCALFIFIISIIFGIWCNFEYFHIYQSWMSHEFAKNLNTFISSISISYFCGYIVFLFTIIFPQANKNQRMTPFIAKEIQVIKDNMYEELNKTFGFRHDTYKYDYEYFELLSKDKDMLSRNKRYINIKLSLLDIRIKGLYSLIEHFSISEQKIYFQLLNSPIWKHKIEISKPNLKKKDKWEKMIKDFIDFYRILELFYSKFNIK